MNIKEVRIKNFRGFGENPDCEDGLFRFTDLNSSLVVLNGFNGNGKTSFFEAIEWCLTDQVERLKGFTDVYEINTLKKCYYLKFFPVDSTEAERNKRIVTVELIFDNGVCIRRETEFPFLKVSDADRYSSRFTASNDQEQALNEEEIARMFTTSAEGSWKEQLINAHFLGQENMSAFYRAKNPAERRSIFMKLLNLNDIEELYDLINTLKNSGKLRTKPTEINEKIEALRIKRGRINEIFEVRKWGTIDQYIEKINFKYRKIRELFAENEYYQEFQQNFNYKDINLNNFILVLNKIKVQQDFVVNQITLLEERKQKLNTISNKINNLKLCSNAREKYNKIAKLNFLIETDYSKISSELSALEGSKVKLFEGKCLLDNETNSLNSLRPSFIEIQIKSLIKQTLSGDFILWDQYFDELRKAKNLFKKACLFNVELEETKLNFYGRVKELKWTSIKEELFKLGNENRNLDLVIKKTEEELGRHDVLNTTYKKVLTDVKEYIIENQKDIKECPICLNSNFDYKTFLKNLENNNNLTQADKLINIIDYSLSAGDSIVNDLTNNITKLKQDKTKNKVRINEISNEIKNTFNYLQTLCFNLFEKVTTVLDQRVLKNAKDKKQIEKDILENKNQIKRYKTAYKEVLQQDNIDSYQLTLMPEIYAIQEQEYNILLEDIKTLLVLNFTPTIEEVDNIISQILTIESLNKYYPDNLEQLNKEISDSKDKINSFNKLKNVFKDILEYQLPSDYADLFDGVGEIDSQIESEVKKLNQINLYKEALGIIHNNFGEIHRKIIFEMLAKNPMINWIYGAITPHPFYKTVNICLDKKGTNTKDESEQILLDQIFSTAQLNVLALSVFLGLGLCQKYSNLNQLLLDDPIQSMDDVNILAFIDVLRALMDSKLNQKRLILSTHDDNFAKLLAIKMRNKDFVQYNFVGFGREGSIFERIS